MTQPAAVVPKLPRALARVPFYYGWIVMVLAAFAMVGTLPGRTQGLGLITESLLRDLQIDRLTFARMNLWATLIGSLSCIGVGRLQDRLGSRAVLTAVSAMLGAVVLAMSTTTSVAVMFVLLVLSRGLGQSALSVISLTMVGQWFRRRLSLAMGIYSVVMSMGFMLAFPLVGSVVVSHGWRTAWAGIGWCLLPGLAVEPFTGSPDKLIQGPLADALTHVGQLAMMRGMAGLPVRPESYAKAAIVAGRVGLDQEAPRAEFDGDASRRKP
jgi:MFS family permease